MALKLATERKFGCRPLSNRGELHGSAPFRTSGSSCRPSQIEGDCMFIVSLCIVSVNYCPLSNRGGLHASALTPANSICCRPPRKTRGTTCCSKVTVASRPLSPPLKSKGTTWVHDAMFPILVLSPPRKTKGTTCGPRGRIDPVALSPPLKTRGIIYLTPSPQIAILFL